MKDVSFQSRKKGYKRNDSLESFLNEINDDLWIAEKELLEDELNRHPLLFIVGPHRSGSTLMTQWLGSIGQFSYPTNMLSRFYKAPIIGAKIQRLLTDEKYNYRNEIKDFSSDIDYKSQNGKTLGALSPNEFWYFWRRFFEFGELDYKSNEDLENTMDMETFKKELYGITSVFDKPFALKAMICNYNIDFLDKIFDKAIFIYTKRDPYTNIESALKARERQLGSIDKWYSFKIPEYPELIKIEDPIKETAGQIYCINRAVQEGLSNVEEDRKVTVDYEEFCKEPKRFYDEIIVKLNNQGYSIENNYNGPEKFEVTRKEVENKEIVKAYDYFAKNGI